MWLTDLDQGTLLLWAGGSSASERFIHDEYIYALILQTACTVGGRNPSKEKSEERPKETTKSNENQEKNAKRGYANTRHQGKDILDSRRVEGRSLWPVAESSRIAPDTDPLGVRRCGTIEDKQHVPSGRADVHVWRRFDSTVIARAGHLGGYETSPHQVTVGAGGGGHKGDLQVCCGPLEELDVDMVSLTILPLFIYDGERGLGPPVGQVRRDVNFNSEFLGEFFTAIREVGLGVRS